MFFSDTLMEYSSDSSLMNLEMSDKRRFFRHDALTCLNCCRVREKNIKKAETGAISKKGKYFGSRSCTTNNLRCSRFICAGSRCFK